MNPARTSRTATTPDGGTPRPARDRRPALALVGGLAALALLGACASGEPGSETTSDATTPDEEVTLEPTATPVELELVAGSTVVGLPDGLGPQLGDAQAGVAPTADPSLLYVITFGSSTCPAVPDELAEATGDGAVTITFPEPGDGPCTMDYVPSTTVVGLPEPVDPASDLVVTVGTLGEVTLPAGSEDVVWSVVTG